MLSAEARSEESSSWERSRESVRRQLQAGELEDRVVEIQTEAPARSTAPPAASPTAPPAPVDAGGAVGLTLAPAQAGSLADCARREIVTSHAAFGYLARRYRLTQVPVMGLSPEAEPSPAD